MSKSINFITIIITLEGNEKTKTSKNDNKSVWIKSREHLHVEWLLFFVLFPWKSCNVNGRRSQGLMAASGMIQTPWYSKDHSSQNLSEIETTQILTKFFKNNIFHIRWKLCRWNEKKKTENSKNCPSSPRYPNTSRPTFWQRGDERLKLCNDLDGFPLYFWPSERRPDIKRSPKKSNLRTFMSVANLSLGAPPR